jgi:hypothetical protein
MPRPEPAAAASRLTDRELGTWTRRRRLALDARQRRANQRTVNGAVFCRIGVVGIIAVAGFDCVVHGSGRAIQDGRFGFRHRARRGIVHLVLLFGSHSEGTRRSPPRRHHCTLWQLARCGVRLPTLSGHSSLLVLVFRVAGRAPGLLHIRTDHGDDGVIREAPLARTVVIQGVTKPKLALLHQELPNGTSLAGKGIAKGTPILTELVSPLQYRRVGYPAWPLNHRPTSASEA